MERNRPDPAPAALPAPQSVLDMVAFDACDCIVPAAGRLRAAEALADAGRPPAGGLATAGAAADATRGGEPHDLEIPTHDLEIPIVALEAGCTVVSKPHKSYNCLYTSS
jgi:hypothetical protein